MNEQIKNLWDEALQLENEGDLHSAIKKHEEIVEIEEKNVDSQFKIGELYHQLGDLTSALSAYLKTIDADPNHQKSKVKIEMIQSILNFYNKDMYNP